MNPYTYLIGWKYLDKWYYGVRYANSIIAENDLWVKYFTSSKHVKDFRKIHGEPDVVEVRRTFNTKEEAIEWETKVLRKMNILYSERWINKNICKCIEYTEDVRQKISQAHKGKIISEEHRKSISEKLTGHIFSEERNNKISAKLKGKLFSEEHKKKLSEAAKSRKGNGAFKGRKHSEETKAKIAETKRRKRALLSN